MRIIDADKFLEDMKSTDRYFMVKFDIERAPTVDLWHYPSKGELPDKDGEYLCRYYKYDIRFSKVLLYRVKDNKWYNLVYDEEYRAPKPDAWQYFVLPKEEE